MKNVLAVFSLLSIGFYTLSAQGIGYKVQVVDADDVPSAAITAQERFFSGISVNRWEKHTISGKENSKDRFVAAFKKDGQNTRARYTQEGIGISATTYYLGSQLPQAIQDAAAANYAGYKLVSGEQIQLLEKSDEAYRIRLRKGAQKLVVYVDEHGDELDKPEVPTEMTEGENEAS